MKFAYQTAIRNIRRKPFRAMAMAMIVMLLAFTLFAGAYTIVSMQKGLESYRTRLGADIVVVPVSATSHGAVDEIFLQGITGNYYMAGKEVEKVCSVEGIESCSKQFFLTSAKASCCSSRVQIIGFDPDTDFTVMPWISERYAGTLEDGDLVVGANINVPMDRTITFYGENYHVAAQLERTGTGLDSAVYTNMNTVRQMAENAANLLETSPFEGVSINSAASAVMIRVKDGYSISDVADDINIHITKVEATSARSMISQISEGLGNVSGIIGILVAVIWILAAVILVIAFAMLSNERKKEFAVLRVMGASRKLLFRAMSAEAVLISAAGAAAGLILAVAISLPLSSFMQDALGLPFLRPPVWMILLFAVLTLVISVLAGVLTSYFSAGKMTKSETGLLLREDA